MKGNKFNISYFKCIKCKNTIPLPRPNSRQRNKFHKKDIYCIYCKEINKMIEFREKDFYI